MAEIVAYTEVTVASIHGDSWDEAWFTLETWKGFLQSFPGLQSTKILAKPLENGDVRVYIFTQWDFPENLEEWRKSKLSAYRMLEKLDPIPYDINHDTLENFS